MATISVSDADFEEKVLKSDKPVVLDFWAQWCGPCKMVGPVLEEISGERDDVIIAKMDIDANSDTPLKFGVRSIPTLIVFKGGESVATALGAKPKAALNQWIDGAL